MKPSMGRAVMGSGCFFGGNLWGNVRFQYFSGNLEKDFPLQVSEGINTNVHTSFVQAIKLPHKFVKFLLRL